MGLVCLARAAVPLPQVVLLGNIDMVLQSHSRVSAKSVDSTRRRSSKMSDPGRRPE